MKNEEKYNGWTNYATWRVNLELFDGYEVEHEIEASYVEELAEEYIFSTGEDSLQADYARAFIADVNWQEIAEHITEDFSEEYKA